MDKEMFEKKVDWFSDLKKVAGNICQDRVIQEMLVNANKNGYGWTDVIDIQNAWRDTVTEQDRETVAGKIMRCINEGYFMDWDNLLKPHWKYVMEKELMIKLKLDYVEDEDFEDIDGCLAKQGSCSKVDVLKRVSKTGKKLHKYICTLKAPTAVDDNKRRERKKQRSVLRKRLVPPRIKSL
jgi:hypothetical protein